MKTLESIQQALSLATTSFASLLKVALQSRHPDKPCRQPDRELVILGNGPSLRSLLDDNRGFLEDKDLLCVNFAANTPEYFELQPALYVLADPHFFNGCQSDPNVKRLWENIARTSWAMQLFIPCGATLPEDIKIRIETSPMLTLCRFNITPVEGWKWLRHNLYAKGLGMPRPRNVLIPSLMIAIRSGYSRIYVAGADHTWSKTLDVDDRNHVVSVQPHFYNDSEKEQKRVNTEYTGYHLHDILLSLYTAFRSYHLIQEYARNRNVKIINITPGSMIDAFERLKI